MAEQGRHFAHEASGGDHPRYEIGFREKKPFHRRRIDSELPQHGAISRSGLDRVDGEPQGRFSGLGNIEEGETFGDREPSGFLGASHQGLEQGQGCLALLQFVEPGLESPVVPADPGHDAEPPPVDDDVMGHEAVGHFVETRAGRQEHFFGWGVGRRPLTGSEQGREHDQPRSPTHAAGRLLSRKCCRKTAAAKASTSSRRPRVLPPCSRIAARARAVDIRSSHNSTGR